MPGVAVMSVAGSPGSVVPGNFPASITVTDLGGAGVNGPRVTFGTDGTTAGVVTGTGSPTVTESWGDPNWFLPTFTGIGSSYWIRLTATSGSFTTNAASSFVQLNTSRAATFTQAGGAGTATVTFTIDIATDSGGTNIVLSVGGNTMTSVR